MEGRSDAAGVYLKPGHAQEVAEPLPRQRHAQTSAAGALGGASQSEGEEEEELEEELRVHDVESSAASVDTGLDFDDPPASSKPRKKTAATSALGVGEAAASLEVEFSEVDAEEDVVDLEHNNVVVVKDVDAGVPLLDVLEPSILSLASNASNETYNF